MKIIFPIRVILTFSFYLILANTTLLAQKTDPATSITGAGRIVMYTDFVGTIGNKEIRSNVKAAGFKYNYNLFVFENKKQLHKKDIQIKYNDTNYAPDGYYIKDDKIIAYFIAGTKNTDQVKLCISELNIDLEPIGLPVELVELPKAVDASKLMSSKSGGMFNDKQIRFQELVARYNKKTGQTVFCFSLQLVKEQNLSYCKFILVDTDYKVQNEFIYNATTVENHIKVNANKIFDNQDAMITFSERIETYYEGGMLKGHNVLKQAQIILSSDGNEPKELEVIPDQRRIVNSIIAENLTTKNNICYAIMSMSDEKGSADIGYISLYEYDNTTKELSKKSLEFSVENIFPDKPMLKASFFFLSKIFNLSDGSKLLWLRSAGINSDGYSYDRGNLFIKLDEKNTITWINGFRKTSLSYTWYSGYLDYFDHNDNLNLVFNFPPKSVKERELTTGKNYVDDDSPQAIATINIINGEITFKKLIIDGFTLGGILTSESKNTEENGKYNVHMRVNKDYQFVEVDFNSK